MRNVYHVSLKDRKTGVELATRVRFLSKRLGGPIEVGPGLVLPWGERSGHEMRDGYAICLDRLGQLAALLDRRRRRKVNS